MAGFNDSDQYIDYVMTVGRINKIKVPTMFLQSLDDPIVSAEYHPYKELE
jgi:predicted alpha/beta-fold hydrolase